MKCTDCDCWSLLSSCCTDPHPDKKLFNPEACPHFRPRGSREAEHPCSGCTWRSAAHACFCPRAGTTGSADSCPHYRPQVGSELPKRRYRPAAQNYQAPWQR